jgi:CDP-glycerol glycerophosphotransferase
MKQNLVNFLKYNKIIYTIFYHLFSFFINLIKIFIVPDDKLILFNSYGGRKYDDSPKLIF